MRDSNTRFVSLPVSLPTGTFSLEIRQSAEATEVRVDRDNRLVAKAAAFAGRVIGSLNPHRLDRDFAGGYSTSVQARVMRSRLVTTSAQLRVGPATQADGAFSRDALDLSIHEIGSSYVVRDDKGVPVGLNPDPTTKFVRSVVEQPVFTFPSAAVGENIIVPRMPVLFSDYPSRA